MKKVFSNFFKIIEGICFALIVIYIAFIVFQRFSDNSSIFGYRIFTIASESMFPDYKIGDVIAVKSVPLEELKVGDDITYEGNKLEMKDKIITHRVMEINENELLTKGIANTDYDPRITYDQVLGKVVRKLGIITFFNNIIINKYGFYFLIFLPLVIIIFLEVVDTIRDMKRDNDEEE